MFYRQLTPAQREKIERIIAQGKPSFIWRRGVLGWGLPVFLMTTIWRYIDLFHLHTGQALPFYVSLLALPMWLAGGYFFGVSMWQYYVGLLDRQKN
jgi:hypothetical protein